MEQTSTLGALQKGAVAAAMQSSAQGSGSACITTILNKRVGLQQQPQQQQQQHQSPNISATDSWKEGTLESTAVLPTQRLQYLFAQQTGGSLLGGGAVGGGTKGVASMQQHIPQRDFVQQILKKPVPGSAAQLLLAQNMPPTNSILSRRSDALTQNNLSLFLHDDDELRHAVQQKSPQLARREKHTFEDEFDDQQQDDEQKRESIFKIEERDLFASSQLTKSILQTTLAKNASRTGSLNQPSHALLSSPPPCAQQRNSQKNEHEQQVKFLLNQLKERDQKVQKLEEDNHRIRRERGQLHLRVLDLEAQVRDLQLQQMNSLRMHFAQHNQVLAQRRLVQDDLSFNPTGGEEEQLREGGDEDGEEQKDNAEGEAQIENAQLPLEEQDLLFAMQLQAAEHRQMYQPTDDIDPDNMTYEQLIELGEKIGHVNKGFSKEQIKQIPKFKYEAVHVGVLESCAVCYSDFKMEEGLRRLTPCQHTYHRKCIKEWLLMEKKCPMCKTEVQLEATTTLASKPPAQKVEQDLAQSEPEEQKKEL